MKNLVGQKAPDFVSDALINKKITNGFSLSQFKGQKVLLFFYPLDFTFVCPTELHAFQEAAEKFKELGVQVMGCSVDSVFSHQAWVNTPKAKGGIEGVTYPLISDLNKTIATDFGVLSDTGVAFRGLFLIDQKGIIRHMLVNDLPLGRSVDEAIRVVEALNFHEQHGEVCPANWNSSKKAMKPTTEGLKQYFSAV
jgi:peroxiredoxin 2/4